MHPLKVHNGETSDDVYYGGVGVGNEGGEACG